MKKLVVLIMVLALMAIALPVMASDVSFSGELTSAFMSDFSAKTTTPTASNASISLAAKVDKNNTVNAEFGTDATLTPAFNNFYLVSDLGGAFNLSGFDPVLTVGYGDPATATTLGVSGYGNENVVVSDPGANSIGTEIALATAIGKTANVFIALDPTLLTTPKSTSFVASADGTFGPIMAAIYYGVSAGDVAKGSIGGGVKYATTMSGIDLSADGQVAYDLAGSGSTAVSYGGGVSAGVKMVSGGIGYNGGGSKSAQTVTANVALTPSDMFGLDLGAGLNFASGATAFDTLDVSGYVMVGKAKIRVGYLHEAAGWVVGSQNAPSDFTSTSAPTYTFTAAKGVTSSKTTTTNVAGDGLYASFDLSF